jgi:phosphate transport system substrate-binding protein
MMEALKSAGRPGPGLTASAAALSAVMVLSAAGCSRSAGTGDFTLAGSTSVQPFAEKWVEAYRARPGAGRAAIHVQGGGSTAGVQAAQTGAAQIGMCSRELKPDEASKLVATVVARDGIAVIVNKANPVSDLALAQVQKIYAGQAPTWKEVGGGDAKVTLITREDGSGTRGAFEELLMKGSHIASSALVQDSTGAVRQMVASDPAAIGYISLGQVDASVKALKIAGVDATEASIDAGKYPLVRPFLFVTSGAPAGPAADFITWVTGPEGQALTRKEGLLPPKK